MGLQELHIVDAISINEVTGICTLTIIDSLDWQNESEHLFMLQEKLNLYLSFIESGEIYETYPQSKNRTLKIGIRFKNQIPKACEVFLQRALEIITEAGFNLEYTFGSDFN
jgi:Ni,Fe-hydrogenase maturation factor